MPALMTASAKSPRSERNPYPGCMASTSFSYSNPTRVTYEEVYVIDSVYLLEWQRVTSIRQLFEINMICGVGMKFFNHIPLEMDNHIKIFKMSDR